MNLLPLAAGFLITFFNNKINEERKGRIERVNAQLKLFYGPLLACVATTKRAYEALLALHSPDGTREAFQQALLSNPEGEEAKAYRLWMETVIQPLNEKASRVIQEHLDLLDSNRVEQLLLQLVAHTVAYRVCLERWRNGEVSALSAVTYPDKLVEYIGVEFGRIKRRQAELLGIAPRAAGLARLALMPLAGEGAAAAGGGSSGSGGGTPRSRL